MNFNNISNDTKKTLKIDFVTNNYLSFKTDSFEGTIDFYRCISKGVQIDLNDKKCAFLEKNQLDFMIKWLSLNNDKKLVKNVYRNK